MEEEPVEIVPDVDMKDDFIIPQKQERSKTEPEIAKTPAITPAQTDEENSAGGSEPNSSDAEKKIHPLSKEDIIAQAEVKAFAGAE